MAGPAADAGARLPTAADRGNQSSREAYARRLTSPESRDLSRVARRSGGRSGNELAAGRGGVERPQRQSRRLEEELLATLVHATAARRVLDLGLRTGGTALAMAEAMGQSQVRGRHGQPERGPAGEVLACAPGASDLGLVHEVLDQARHGERVIILGRDALGVVESSDRPYDLVRLVVGDGPGALPGAVARDLVQRLLDRELLESRGLLVLHGSADLTAQGSDGAGEEPDGVGEVSVWLAGEQRLRQVMMPLGQGLTLARLAP